MNREIFAIQMKRLSDTFGLENYPKPRVEEIWKECHDLTDEQFEKLIARLIQEVPIKYPPTLPKFREFGETLRKAAVDSPTATIHSIPNRWDQAKEYETADAAIAEVQSFKRLLFKEKADDAEFEKEFLALGQRLYPDTHERVTSLRSMVKAGSIEARAQYVEAAKAYMLRTSVQMAFRKTGVEQQRPYNEVAREKQKQEEGA